MVARGMRGKDLREAARAAGIAPRTLKSRIRREGIDSPDLLRPVVRREVPVAGAPSIAEAARRAGVSVETLKGRVRREGPASSHLLRPVDATRRGVRVGAWASLTAYADAMGLPRGTTYRRHTMGRRLDAPVPSRHGDQKVPRADRVESALGPAAGVVREGDPLRGRAAAMVGASEDIHALGEQPPAHHGRPFGVQVERPPTDPRDPVEPQVVPPTTKHDAKPLRRCGRDGDG